jgi:hypothetical protein
LLRHCDRKFSVSGRAWFLQALARDHRELRAASAALFLLLVAGKRREFL